MRIQTQKLLQAALVQNQLSSVCGALEDGIGHKFKLSPSSQCVRMTTQNDASQINHISLWFECAALLDLGDSRIKHIEPYSGFFAPILAADVIQEPISGQMLDP